MHTSRLWKKRDTGILSKKTAWLIIYIHYMSKPGDYLLEALRKHAEAQIELHRANITTYRLNPAGIGEHSDFVETIEKEMMQIAKYDDILEMLNKYFQDAPKNLLG